MGEADSQCWANASRAQGSPGCRVSRHRRRLAPRLARGEAEDVGVWLFTRPGSRAGTRGAPGAARRSEPAGPARGRPILQAACAQGEAASRTLAGQQASARGGGVRGAVGGSCTADECRQSKPLFCTAQIKNFIQELRF